MKQFDDSEIRDFLLCWDVSGPNEYLTERTKHIMREEFVRTAVAPATQEKCVFMLVALTVTLSLCLFYMFTVGTILRFVLPVHLLDYLRHTLFALTAAGGSIVVCTSMMLVFRYISHRHPEENYGQVRC